MRILKYILFIVPFCISLLSFGQSFSGLEITLGGATTSLRTDFLESVKPGFEIRSGLFVNAPTSSKANIRIGALLSIKRFRIKDEDLQMSYASIPFHIMLDLGPSGHQFYFGPEVYILLNKFRHEEYPEKYKNRIAVGDYTLAAGFQFVLTNKVNLSFGGSIGLAPIVLTRTLPDGHFYSLGTSIGIKI